MFRKNRFLAAVAIGIVATLPLRADDKDFLRPVGDNVPPNLLIVFGNSQTLTQTLGFTGTATSTWDGDGDSPKSKLGAGKRVIRQFIADNHTEYNIGLTTFAHDPNAGSVDIESKHWVYESLDPDFSGDSFAEPVGTLSRWGPIGEGPCTTAISPPCTDRSPAIAVASNAPASGGFFGPAGTGTGILYVSPNARIEQTILQGSYGDAFTDGTLTALTLGTHSIEVRKAYRVKEGNAWVRPQGFETPAGNPDEVTVRYRPPSSFTQELFYPAGTPYAGDLIGFLNDDNGGRNSDFDVNANCSGWEFQTNANQVPLVKIPRDYYWGEACNPPQDSLPCVKRMMRPQAYIETYDPVTGFATADPDNPGYTTGVLADRFADGCDANLMGAVQAGLDVVENNAILTNRNGSQAPIKQLLNNIKAYFTEPRHDGFSNGARLDDPNASCRNSAVILIYDNFNGCQNDSCAHLKNQALTELNAIGVPVFVIGYGAQANQGACAADPLTDACPLYCIPKHSGAKKSNGDPGYFPVTSEAELYLALTTIANLVNESQKGFVASTVSVAQSAGEQVTFLATFNAATSRSIWNGRVNAYKLDPSGNLQLGSRRITDPNDPLFGQTVPAPSNAPTSLMWNAGENLSDTPGTGATNPSAVLVPGATRSTGVYEDNSNTSTSTIGTSFYPGRKIVYSLPQTYPNPPDSGTLFPFAAADAMPEIRRDLVAPAGSLPFSSPPPWWPATKALLSPQSSPPFALYPPIEDDDAVDTLRFLWGDRDAVILEDDPNAAGTAKLYGGQKLGDMFHSNPLLVGPPSDYALFATNVNNYQAFRETYRRRRRMLLVGANDGLLHAFDAGAWNRNPAQCDLLPDGVTRAKCYDLGTGMELFAYAPRSIMQIFKSLKDARGPQSKRNQWTVDGPPTAGDVFIDSAHGGTPDPSQRAWHTIVIGGTREGTPFEGTSGEAPRDSFGSYYALDITQPDELVVDTTTGAVTPPGGNESFAASYNAPLCLNADGHTSCGKDAADASVRSSQPARAWPTVLWEISDIGDQDAPGTPGAGYIDMAETWSKPSLGRLRVCTANCGTQTPVLEDRYAAIFGGGFDRERQNRRGNWLYMVDVETGHVLYRANSSCGVNSGAGGCSPTYFGAIPGELAAHDGNGDGSIDIVYFGDLKGRVWRIDTTDLRLMSSPPAGRWSNKIDVEAGSGKPFLFFDAPQPPPAETHPFYPIYHKPTLVSLGYNIAGKPAVGVAIGTGDRDDITGRDEPQSLTYKQRFYYVVDRNNATTRTETDLLDIPSPTAAGVTTAPPNGWFLQLPLGERIITDSLGVGGVIFFTAFNPLMALNPTNPCPGNTPECGLAAGTARLYRVFYSTGNAYVGSDRGEVQQFGGFLSEPVYFESTDQTGRIIYTTENIVKSEKSPGGKKTTVKSWKERSRRP